MATESNEIIDELKLVIKGLLFARPTVIKANQLLKECELEMVQIPLHKLGFRNFIDFLKSIPTVCQLKPENGLNPDVIPVRSEASSHIDQLVSKQKMPPRKKGSSACVPRRRTAVTPPRVPQRQNQVDQDTVQLQQGFNARDSSDHLENNRDRVPPRNGYNNVKAWLSHTDDSKDRHDVRHEGASNFTYDTKREKCIPAEDAEVLYDGESDMDSEEMLAQQVFEQYGVVENENNRYSSRSPFPCDGTSASGVSFSGGMCDQKAYNTDDVCNISDRMISNFRKILDNHPEGIWSTELQTLYYNYYGVRLDLRELNFSSMISLAAALPRVFSYRREGTHDFKLYDARFVSQPSLEAKGEIVSTDSDIPQKIIDNIKNLLKTYSNGFRTTDLLTLYSETYNKPLRFKDLGFGTLNDFLMQLTNDVTLMQRNDYYIMLPKHQRVSYEAFEPPKPDDGLKIPPEALNVPIPDDVMKFGEKIPTQHLPEVQGTGPDDPLMEMEVMVAEVISPVYFYMTLANMHERLENMMDDLHKFYMWEEENFKIPVPHIVPNLYCAIKYENYWHRAKILRVKENDKVKVEYIDYGTPQTVDFSVLRYLSKSFATLPAQAICAKLIGVRPTKEQIKFPPEVCNAFLNLVAEKTMVAHVYNVLESVKNEQERLVLEIILFDVANPNAEIVVNDHLIKNGLASPIALQPEDSLLPDEEILLDNYSPQVNGELPPLLPSNSPQVNGELPPLLPSNLPQVNGELPLLPPLAPSNSTSLLEDVPPSSRPTSSVDAELKILMKTLSQCRSRSSHSSLAPKISSFNLYKMKQHAKPSRGPPPGFTQIIHDEPKFGVYPPTVTASSTYSSQTQPSNDLSIVQYQHELIKALIHLNSHQTYPAQLGSNTQMHSLPNPSYTSYAGQPLYLVNPHPPSYAPYGNVFRPQIVYHHNGPPHQNLIPVNTHASSVPLVVPSTLVFPNNGVVPYFGTKQPTQRNIANSANFQNFGNPYIHNHPSTKSAAVAIQPPSSPITLDPIKYMATPPPSTDKPSASTSTSLPTPTPPPLAPKLSASPSTSLPTLTPPPTLPTPPPSLPTPPQPAPKLSASPSTSLPTLSPPPSLPTPPPPAPKLSASPSISLPTLTHPPPLHHPTSPSPTCTPINFPEWPPTHLPAIFTKASCETHTDSGYQFTVPDSSKSELSDACHIPRPATPLTPASAEVADICNLSEPNSSSLQDSKSQFKSLIDAQTEMTELVSSINSSSPLYPKVHSPLQTDKREIALSQDLQKGIFIPASAISSPVNPLISPSPLKEESSNDHASASENVEAISSFSNLTLTNQHSVQEFNSPCEPSDDILDSWENLDIDDTPVAASALPENINEQLILIVQNLPKPTNIVDTKEETLLKTDKIPINWKDAFDPDTNSITRGFDNNNGEKKSKKSPPFKFGVQKIPVQELSIQMKPFHLLLVDGEPHVIALEFLSQFTTGKPSISVKVLELKVSLPSITKAKYPSILNELNKLNRFYGDVEKRTVIKMNKVMVLKLSDIPISLEILNNKNEPLLKDLKKIADELSQS